MTPKEIPQLYNLFNRLGYFVRDQDLLGMLVGYSVVGSLIDFNVGTEMTHDTEIEEVKTVHGGLDNLIDKCHSYHNNTPLKFLKEKVDPRLRSGETFKRSGETSLLMAGILDSLSYKKGKYDDAIRQMGLGLIRNVTQRGKVIGERNIFKEDYESLESCFSYRERSE